MWERWRLRLRLQRSAYRATGKRWREEKLCGEIEEQLELILRHALVPGNRQSGGPGYVCLYNDATVIDIISAAGSSFHSWGSPTVVFHCCLSSDLWFNESFLSGSCPLKDPHDPISVSCLAIWPNLCHTSHTVLWWLCLFLEAGMVPKLSLFTFALRA